MLATLEDLARIKMHIKTGAVHAWYETALAILGKIDASKIAINEATRQTVTRILELLKKPDETAFAAAFINLVAILDTALTPRFLRYLYPDFVNYETVECLAAMAASDSTLSSDDVDNACRVIDRNIYKISDEQAATLLAHLNGIASSTPSLQKLKTRLKDFPDKKIPQLISFICHGKGYFKQTIENLLAIRNSNPSFMIRVYADSKTAVESELAEWVSENAPFTKEGFTARYKQVKNLRKKLDIRCHDEILSAPSIKEKYPKLTAYAQRFGEATLTAPNYALMSDIERYACLQVEGGWYFDCDFKLTDQIAPNARAEAGIAVHSADLDFGHGVLVNNPIIGAHPASPVISEILEKIHTDFDKPGDKLEPESSLKSGLDYVYKNYYKPANFDERIGTVPFGEEPLWEPPTMHLGRFSYVRQNNFGINSISRSYITMESTGPTLLSNVLNKHLDSLLSGMAKGDPDHKRALEDHSLKINTFTKNFRLPNADGLWGKNVYAPKGTAGETAFPLIRDPEAESYARAYMRKRAVQWKAERSTVLRNLDQGDVESLLAKFAEPEKFTRHDIDLMKYHFAKGGLSFETNIAPGTEHVITLQQAIHSLLQQAPDHRIGDFMVWVEAFNKKRGISAS